MNNTVKLILTLLAIAAVIAYTVSNYVSGRIDAAYLVVCIAIVGIPLVNIIRILLSQR